MGAGGVICKCGGGVPRGREARLAGGSRRGWADRGIRAVMALSVRPQFLPVVALTVLVAACGDDTGREDATAASGTDVDPSGLTVPPVTSTEAPATTTDLPTGADTTSNPSGVSGSTSSEPSTGAVSATEPGSTGPGTTMTTGGPGETTDTSGETSASSTGDAPCAMGTQLCEANVLKVCDGMGGFSSETPCAKECDEVLGCIECTPGSYQCVGPKSQVCAQDGSAWIDGQTCDEVQGLSCDANTGECAGACANLGTSYIGCDYYPVVTQQLDIYVGANPYAVAVANTTNQEATITITRGANAVANGVVAAGSVKVFPLPWVNELAKGTGPTALVVDGAYRLRSTQPVTVYQYNPLNADVTNDASLMLPVNTWTGNYLVAAWQYWSGYPGFYSVTASQDNTKVTLKAPKGGVPTQAGGGVDGQGNGVVMMNEGDVLQVMTGNGGDETGAIVTADKPVQVVGGHDCTQVPIGTAACDHLEESMFPIEALAKEYIVVPPVQVPNDQLEKAIRVRIIASEDNTTLTFDPDQPVGKLLAKAGDFVEIPNTTAKFVVKSDKKILVAEYMVGQNANFGTSDPAMIIAVPTAQFRSNYLFYAQTGWQANYVDIIAPDGSATTVDGAPVNNFKVIGATGYSLAHVKLSNAGDGSHTVASDKKVGITVYGVVNYGSYWYPGGLDLDVIPQ